MRKPFGAFAFCGVAAFAASNLTPVLAQDFDPNLISTIETFIPEPEPTVIPRETVIVPVKRERTEIVPVPVPIPVPLSEQRAQFEARSLSEQNEQLEAFLPPDQTAQFIVLTPKQILDELPDEKQRNLFKAAGIDPFKTRTEFRPVTKVFTEYQEREGPAKVQAVLTGTSGYDYQSNAATSPTDPVADSIARNLATLTVKVPVGRKNDSLTMSITPNAVRYATLDTKSFDSASGSASYSHPFSKRYLSAHRTSGTATQDIVAVALQGVSVHEPGFGSTKIRYITPSVKWERKNIPISDRICGTPGKETYCYFANVVLGLLSDWTSISTQDNARAELTVILGWNTPMKGLTLTAGGKVRGRYYTNVKGGREDLILIPEINASWNRKWGPKKKKTIALSAGASYTEQTSSQPAAEWNGFILVPKVSLSMTF